MNHYITVYAKLVEFVETDILLRQHLSCTHESVTIECYDRVLR
jgi:hypothetical protein